MPRRPLSEPAAEAARDRRARSRRHRPCRRWPSQRAHSGGCPPAGWSGWLTSETRRQGWRALPGRLERPSGGRRYARSHPRRGRLRLAGATEQAPAERVVAEPPVAEVPVAEPADRPARRRRFTLLSFLPARPASAAPGALGAASGGSRCWRAPETTGRPAASADAGQPRRPRLAEAIADKPDRPERLRAPPAHHGRGAVPWPTTPPPRPALGPRRRSPYPARPGRPAVADRRRRPRRPAGGHSAWPQEVPAPARTGRVHHLPPSRRRRRRSAHRPLRPHRPPKQRRLAPT